MNQTATPARFPSEGELFGTTFRQVGVFREIRHAAGGVSDNVAQINHEAA